MYAALDALWTFANTPLGITALSAVVAYLLGRLFTARPAWQQYVGAIVEGIKIAERTIPDDADNRAARRLDAALAHVLRIYHAAEGRLPTPRETERIKDAVRAKHAELEAAGNLDRKAPAAPR